MSRHSFPDLSFYSKWMDSHLQLIELFLSCGQVIAYRNMLLLRAAAGEIPLHHPEFSTMWLEKICAGNESMLATWKHAYASAPAASLAFLPPLLAPYKRRVSANIKRLRKSKRSGR